MSKIVVLNRRWPKRLAIGGGVAVALIAVLGTGGLWAASGQILQPSFEGVGEFSECAAQTEAAFGPHCGDISLSGDYEYTEVVVPSENGDLPGWLVKASDNGGEPASDAIMLVHAGGSDRRQMTTFIDFYLNQGLDVLTFDLSCQGEAPCNRAGLTYGDKESLDVLAAFGYLEQDYDDVYAMGSSVGAAAVLIALPQMSELAGAIVENPPASFERLLKEAPESASMPGWFSGALVSLAQKRAGSDKSRSAESALAEADGVPVLFIHSKGDAVIPPQQTLDLADVYGGPEQVWLADKGAHSAIWAADPAAYETTVAAFLSEYRGSN